MRRIDKRTNIEQANLMLENSYLKSKGLLTKKINENMFGNLFGKKDNTPTEISDEEIKQQLVNLANAERTLVQFGKPSNPKNTDEITYTDLNNTKIKDDFTPYYQSMKDLLSKNNNITVKDTYNNKTFNFELQGDTIMTTKLNNKGTN